MAYHQPLPPWDTDWLAVSPSFALGVAIEMDERGGPFDTALLDATPGSIAWLNDIQDGALLPGQTFTDDLAGITITVNMVTQTTAHVTVTIQPRATRFLQVGIDPDTLVNVLASDVGTVTGGGSYAIGQQVIVSATPKPGWAFHQWMDHDANQIVSQANPYTLTIGDDRVLWAQFMGAPPPNDNFSAATAVMVLPMQESVFTLGATAEAGEPFPGAICGNGSHRGKTIWYMYTPTQNQQIKIDTPNSDTARDIAVYTGNAVAMLNPVQGACSIWTVNKDPTVTFSASAGTTYRIQIDTLGGNTGVRITSP